MKFKVTGYLFHINNWLTIQYEVLHLVLSILLSTFIKYCTLIGVMTLYKRPKYTYLNCDIICLKWKLVPEPYASEKVISNRTMYDDIACAKLNDRSKQHNQIHREFMDVFGESIEYGCTEGGCCLEIRQQH